MAQASATAKPASTKSPGGVTKAEKGTSPEAAAKTAATKKPSVPPFQITGHETRKRYLKMLVYGEYGAGKTRLVATSVLVPEMRDVLFIDAEAGDLTLEDDLPDFNMIDYVRIKTFPQIARVQEFLKLHCDLAERTDQESIDRLISLEARFKGIDPEDIEEPRRYQTVIIDSATEVNTFCLYDLLGISDATGIDEETASEEWPEYKKNLSRMQRMIRAFRNLPMHLLMTAARQHKQDEGKRFVYTPKMTGQLTSDIQGFFDVVGYLQLGKAAGDSEVAKEISRRLYVHPIGRFDAKCRFATHKDAYFENPTVKSILESVGLASVTRQLSKSA